MKPQLEQIVSLLPLFQSVFPEDAKLVVFDTDKVIADLNGKYINTPSKVGAPWSEFIGTVSYKAFTQRKMFREERGPEVFGVAYIAVSVPILDGNELLGVLSALVSNNKLNMMKVESEKLSNAVSLLSGTAEGLNKASEDLSSQVMQLFSQSKKIIQALANSQHTLGRVKELSEHSKLMGLNAAIEAARLGELGRGFEVITKEIRKMAEYSKELSGHIQTRMNEIEQSVMQMHKSIQQVADFTQIQTTGIGRMNAAFDQILSTSEELLAFSQLSS